jgi:uncharacterized protein with HEPN domain
MDIKIQAYLSDIKTSIDEIFDFLGDQRDFSEYRNDLKTKEITQIISYSFNRI